MTAVLLILPWGAYWLGLQAIAQLPVAPSTTLSAPRHEWVWSQAKGSGKPEVVPLSPYSYLYNLFIEEGISKRGTQIAWWDASDQLAKQNPQQRALWWALSGAALTIWITRNWTDEQITAAAFIALQRRGEVYRGN